MAIQNLMTKKQIQVLSSYVNDDWKYLILSGAVRSGKTYVDNYLFLLELRRVHQLAKVRHDPKPQYILAGYSSNTIYTNVISSLQSQFGIELPVDRHGHYHLFGVDIVPAYTGSARGMNAIRGMTSYGAYVNETSLSTHDVFQEILDRCSVPNARVLCDTNPDNPQHWLKVDYIDKSNEPKNRIKAFHFTIDDNPTLDPTYVSTLKAVTPSGMYYDRSILGLWVTGEGAVYKDFDERKMIVDKVPPMARYIAGVDWGYQHYGSIVVFGVDKDDNWYLVEEHSEKYKEIDYWTDIAHELQEKYGKNMPFYCDTARTEHIDHFKHSGINALYGWKSVVPGIEIVASLMKQGRFFVEKKAPVRFLDEIYNYQWDDKNEDAVVKENDDTLD
ncbi:phage terminase, large subunit, PBSX family [Limosilactobacillus coleohominis 101-4-CHN]|uniref:Phage terminase, large subunit, PBSX family n=1 Tax=Limosilactobacillus coleohominis 101-4-CHN TaxID=575594 RepID=C7XUU0_9LACO|nr:PBSX family phage terminase large subunit [Limosilactobacillus coleohominis]EEU31051.1 phage terminase, large subunit, PBSX family [Limosilactobacillus coleohominis 101-4-CHN]